MGEGVWTRSSGEKCHRLVLLGSRSGVHAQAAFGCHQRNGQNPKPRTGQGQGKRWDPQRLQGSSEARNGSGQGDLGILSATRAER